MYQYEKGTRTVDPRLDFVCKPTEMGKCDGKEGNPPPLTDPCNNEALRDCGCNAEVSPTPVPFKIRGFQLVESDRVGFVPLDQNCPSMPQNFVDYMKGMTYSNAATGGEQATSARRRHLVSDEDTSESAQDWYTVDDPHYGRMPKDINPADEEAVAEWRKTEAKKIRHLTYRLRVHLENLKV